MRRSHRRPCDPADPAWEPTGGCHQRRGDVTFEEFSELLFTSLSGPSIVGHPAWVMDPTYLKLRTHEALKVKNVGGRGHTFTEVETFGGGFIPDLNGVLTMAPECATATTIPAGERSRIGELPAGEHYFQCCIHPWMRIVVDVEDKHGDGDDDDAGSGAAAN